MTEPTPRIGASDPPAPTPTAPPSRPPEIATPPPAVAVKPGDFVPELELAPDEKPVWKRGEIELTRKIPGARGTFILRVDIDERGRVTSVDVLRGDIPMYRRDVISSVRRFIYEPAQKGGVKVKTQHTFSRHF